MARLSDTFILWALLLFISSYQTTSFICTLPSNANFASSRFQSCLLNSSTANNGKSLSAKINEKSKSSEDARPTARYLAAAALASGSKGADNTDSSAFASRRLDQDVRYKQLDPRDRAFARLLVATVERRLGQIDKVLKSCIDKYPPRGKHAKITRATLRIGVAQLLFLNTPPFAATSDTVQVLRIHHHLAKKSYPVPEPMIRFVNGVLRKLSKPLEAEKSHYTMYGHELLASTSGDDNISPWLLQRWKEDWGDMRAKLIRDEMMPSGYDEITPRIDVTTMFSIKSLIENVDQDGQNSSKDALCRIQEEFDNDCTLLPQGSLRIGSSLGGDVANWPGYNDGTWWVQDASSTLPAITLTHSLYEKYDGNLNSLHVVDMCSAPGGKTSQLLSAGFGRITAIEASEKRSRRLVDNLERLNLSKRCEVIVTEGQHYNPPENEVIHGILLDVPCSATGTGVRRPDVLRRTSDLSELLHVQALLANHCADKILNPGGILVYATCSILKAESKDQVAKLIAQSNKNPNSAKMTTLPIQAHEVPGFEDAIDENGWLRVLPGVLKGDLQSTDGFFVARLLKI